MQAAAAPDFSMAAPRAVAPQPGSAASLNIMHILRAPVGGLFRHVLDIARGQAERGHRVGLIVDCTTGGARADAALAELEPLLALGLKRVAIARELGPSDVAALRAIAGHVKTRRAGRAARPRRQRCGAGAACADRAGRNPGLHAARRLAGLSSGHHRRQLLSLAGMAVEVAHRSVPVREPLCRRPVPRPDRPHAGVGAGRAQRRRRERVRPRYARRRCDRSGRAWRIAAGQGVRRADRGAGDAQSLRPPRHRNHRRRRARWRRNSKRKRSA